MRSRGVSRSRSRVALRGEGGSEIGLGRAAEVVGVVSVARRRGMAPLLAAGAIAAERSELAASESAGAIAGAAAAAAAAAVAAEGWRRDGGGDDAPSKPRVRCAWCCVLRCGVLGRRCDCGVLCDGGGGISSRARASRRRSPPLPPPPLPPPTPPTPPTPTPCSSPRRRSATSLPSCHAAAATSVRPSSETASGWLGLRLGMGLGLEQRDKPVALGLGRGMGLGWSRETASGCHRESGGWRWGRRGGKVREREGDERACAGEGEGVGWDGGRRLSRVRVWVRGRVRVALSLCRAARRSPARTRRRTRVQRAGGGKRAPGHRRTLPTARAEPASRTRHARRRPRRALRCARGRAILARRARWHRALQCARGRAIPARCGRRRKAAGA